MERICPECGRTLITRRNRYGVEMWPSHMFAAASQVKQPDRNRIYAENANREAGRRDWEVPCHNSAQPV